MALRAFASIPESERKGRMRPGRVATGDVFVADEALRARISREFSPACVEMEGGAIAQVCQANEVPFLILRSLSDLAGEEATVSYEDFSHEASRVSARVVLKTIEELAHRA
jgi:adenosylhomocysteine nucleosidase